MITRRNTVPVYQGPRPIKELQFLITLLPTTVRRVLKPEGPWLAGGALVRLFTGEQWADFDFFHHEGWLVPEEWKVNRVSKFATTYGLNKGALTVQKITRVFPTLPDVLESFDFTARMIGTNGVEVFAGQDTLMDLNQKTLRRNPSQSASWTPASSLFGLIKYGNRGFTLDHAEARNFMDHWGVKGDKEYYG